MFTGIVESTAKVLEKHSAGLSVERPALFSDIKLGSSISVAGVCLTVSRLRDNSIAFDVIPETWSKTNLSTLKAGDDVNLERAMPSGGRLDGHIVQGHIEGTGKVVLQKHGQLIVELPSELITNVVSKGSIAIDGVSLTVASVEKNRVTVALIPHTLAMTTLGRLRNDDRVNIETDILHRAHS